MKIEQFIKGRNDGKRGKIDEAGYFGLFLGSSALT